MKPADQPTPTDTVPTASAEETSATADQTSATTDLIEEELLIEEISIDGMCGVY